LDIDEIVYIIKKERMNEWIHTETSHHNTNIGNEKYTYWKLLWKLAEREKIHLFNDF
jgi:hypothetical protein